MIRPAIGLFLLVLLVGCQSHQQDIPSTQNPSPHKTPEWVLQPTGPEGQLGGVGVSRPHVRGLSHQRQTAVSRAIDELARQLGVTVESVLTDQQRSVNGGQLAGETTIVSFQTTTGEMISARLRSLWKDPQSKELYAWMTLEPKRP